MFTKIKKFWRQHSVILNLLWNQVRSQKKLGRIGSAVLDLLNKNVQTDRQTKYIIDMPIPNYNKTTFEINLIVKI